MPSINASEFYPSNHRRKLLDLPEFSGKPERWPMFFESFNESTKTFGYSELENNIRLQNV